MLANDLNTLKYTHCPNYLICVKQSGESLKTYKKVNTTINDYGDGKIEVIKYNNAFKVVDKSINDKTDKSRSFKKVDDILIPKKPSSTPAKLDKLIQKSTSRAQRNFNLYSRANKWSYFFTFTFSPTLGFNRFDDDFIKSCWRKLQRQLKYLDKDVKIMEVHERHEDGAIHFHAPITFTKDLLIVDYGDISKLPQRTCEKGYYKGKTGFCTFKKDGSFTCLPKAKEKVFLVPYYNYGEVQRSSLGDMLFCLSSYKHGINSCAILPLDDTNQGKVASYLSTYCSKQSNLGYNVKRFRRTRNIACGSSETTMCDDNKFGELVLENNLQVYKETDDYTIWRTENLLTKNE
jgi:hypothetical protein